MLTIWHFPNNSSIDNLSKSSGIGIIILFSVVKTSCSGKKPLEFSGLEKNSE